jgi:hypothetical protein
MGKVDGRTFFSLPYLPIALRERAQRIQPLKFTPGGYMMKSMLMAIMAVAAAVTFSAPAFAGEEDKHKKDEKKGGHVLVYGDDEKAEKKDEKKGGY